MQVRRARDRIYRGRQLVADFRAGTLDHLPRSDSLYCLGRTLDYCDRFGDVPRFRSGTPVGWTSKAAKARGGRDRTVPGQAGGQLGPMMELHLTPAEAFSFAVLLAAHSSLNVSVLKELKAPHARATAADEPGIALVDLYKPRRADRARWTYPLTSIPPALHPIPASQDERRIPETSLTTAYGVYRLLLDLTEPARRLRGTDHAFVYFSGNPTDGSDRLTSLRAGIPSHLPEAMRRWFKIAITGADPAMDRVLSTISLDRIRKTRLRISRKPTAHTRATFHRYLRNMDAVSTEGFQIIKEVLNAETAKALARRELIVVAAPSNQDTEAVRGKDTVLAACVDFEHSPKDNDGPCRQGFMACLDCRNARALPQHLPFQIHVLDTLKALRPATTAAHWALEHAGRIAQLESVIEEFEPAQIDQGRQAVTDTHRRIVARLFHGDLDPV